MENELSNESYYFIKEKVGSLCDSINLRLENIRKLSPESEDLKNKEENLLSINLMTLLSYLVDLQPDSYSYKYGSNHASQNLNYGIANFLRNIVEQYVLENKTNCDPTVKKIRIEEAFTAYYILAYMQRLYEPDSLLLFLDTYEKFFLEKYALAYQIRGRELRAQGKFWEAVKNDELALAMLKSKNIENIGVRVTYASSIALALEAQNENIDESYLKKALENVNQAIQINRTYARYHYLIAKLRLYWVKKQVYEKIKIGISNEYDNNYWEYK